VQLRTGHFDLADAKVVRSIVGPARSPIMSEMGRVVKETTGARLRPGGVAILAAYVALTAA
jgi:hypothetical protein